MDRNKLIDLFRNALCDDQLMKVSYKGNEYYYLQSISYEATTHALAERVICHFTVGLEGLMNTCIFWQPTETAYLINSKVGKRMIYPDLFESFWASFHAKRRMDKRQSYIAWMKLNDTEREILPAAAKRYCDKIELESHYKYIKHPERFIRHRTFEDYPSDDKDVTIGKKAMEYYSKLFERKHGFGYNFTGFDKESIGVDVETMQVQKFAHLAWVFFSDKDPKIKAIVKEKGYKYSVFSALCKGPLSETKVKMPEKCPVCGKYGTHDKKCPELVKMRIESVDEKHEVEVARDMNVSITDMFKKKIGRE